MQSALLGEVPVPEMIETSLFKYLELPLLLVPSLGLRAALLSLEGSPLSVKTLGVRIKH